MKSDIIRNRLESRYFVICTDEQYKRNHKEFDILQDAYNYALKQIPNEKVKEVELEIDIENNSESEFNVVKNETIYIKESE